MNARAYNNTVIQSMICTKNFLKMQITVIVRIMYIYKVVVKKSFVDFMFSLSAVFLSICLSGRFIWNLSTIHPNIGISSLSLSFSWLPINVDVYIKRSVSNKWGRDNSMNHVQNALFTIFNNSKRAKLEKKIKIKQKNQKERTNLSRCKK